MPTCRCRLRRQSGWGRAVLAISWAPRAGRRRRLNGAQGIGQFAGIGKWVVCRPSSTRVSRQARTDRALRRERARCASSVMWYSAASARRQSSALPVGFRDGRGRVADDPRASGIASHPAIHRSATASELRVATVSQISSKSSRARAVKRTRLTCCASKHPILSARFRFQRRKVNLAGSAALDPFSPGLARRVPSFSASSAFRSLHQPSASRTTSLAEPYRPVDTLSLTKFASSSGSDTFMFT